MNWYVALPLVAFALELGLAFVAIRRDWKSLLHRMFALFLFSMSLWSLTIFRMRASSDLAQAYGWERLVMITFPLISVTFYHFALHFIGARVRTRTIAPIYLLAYLFMGLGTTPLVVRGMQMKFYGYAPILGPLFFPYIAFVYAVFLLGLARLISTYRHAASAYERSRAGYMVAGLIALFLGATSDFLPAMGAPNYPMGILGGIFFAIITAIAMLKYHLLDIHVVIRRGLAYSVVSALAISSYLLVLFMVNVFVQAREITLLGSVLVILGIAIVFQPILNRVQRRVDRWFYRERLDYLKALEQFSQETKSIVALEKFSSSLVGLVRPALQVTSACLLLHSSDQEGQFTVQAVEGLGEDGPRSMGDDGPLTRWLTNHDDILFRRDIEIIPNLQVLSAQERALLDGLRMEMIVGLRARDKLVGMLILGPKRSGEVYGDDDLKLVNVVARQVAITFDNAALYQAATKAYEELKEAQDRLVQSERLRALGEMAGGVAHDFNNLLAAVLGRAQLALDYAENDMVRTDLEIIQQAALDGAETVKRLQDFARIRVDRESSLVDLNELVETALSFVEPRRREREQTAHASFNLMVSLGQAPPVLGNSRELRQVLTNIMLNAMDAMGQGGTLSVKTEEQNGMAVIAIADTGTGILPEIQAKVFDPFFTTKGPRGTGLGLSVTYGIVHRHGGTVDLVSTPGQGSTFYIRLPVATKAVKRADSTVEELETVYVGDGSGRPSSNQGASVLIIDDDYEVGEVLRRMLGHMGYEVRVATDGEDGMGAFHGGSFILVVVDMGLPGMSGQEVAKEIKSSRPGTPVIMITGWGTLLDPKEMRGMGVDAVVSKPFTREEINRKVSELLHTGG